jgi:hypothetical protein
LCGFLFFPFWSSCLCVSTCAFFSLSIVLPIFQYVCNCALVVFRIHRVTPVKGSPLRRCPLLNPLIRRHLCPRLCPHLCPCSLLNPLFRRRSPLNLAHHARQLPQLRSPRPALVKHHPTSTSRRMRLLPTRLALMMQPRPKRRPIPSWPTRMSIWQCRWSQRASQGALWPCCRLHQLQRPRRRARVIQYHWWLPPFPPHRSTNRQPPRALFRLPRQHARPSRLVRGRQC